MSPTRDVSVITLAAVVVALASIATVAGQEARSPLASALVGRWTGTLEYRDYRSDKRVTLPTTLVVTAESGDALQFAYRYDEGGGRFVTSADRVTIVLSPATYRVQSDDGKNDTTYQAEGLSTFGNGVGTVILTGRGRENNEDVEVRVTITVGPSTLTMLRESLKPGDEWRFRNRYTFAR